MAFFELALPDQSANVDINMAMPGGLSADIGRIPRMELRGATESAEEVVGFTEQIPIVEARTRLRREFYPFARVEWLELGEALQAARAQEKPLHVIALFGSLDDESC